MLVARALPAGLGASSKMYTLFPDGPLVLLLYRLLRDARVSRADKILVGAVLVYVASPIDIIPDFVPLAGQVMTCSPSRWC